MVWQKAFERFEALEHCKVNGFYDKQEDMYFKDLNEWLAYTGFTWTDVYPQ